MANAHRQYVECVPNTMCRYHLQPVMYQGLLEPNALLSRPVRVCRSSIAHSQRHHLQVRMTLIDQCDVGDNSKRPR
jgi:hypothetical protein